MSELPKLKTGSAMQYPSTRGLGRRVRILRFVDGTEQRFPLDGKAHGQWRMSFRQLDDTERRELERFVEESAASGSVISIVDPWDGRRHDQCRLEGDKADIQMREANDNRLDLILSEDPE